MRDMALRFHPDDASFNRTNALYLAHAADIAYHRAPAAAAMARLSLRVISFGNKMTRREVFWACATRMRCWRFPGRIG